LTVEGDVALHVLGEVERRFTVRAAADERERCVVGQALRGHVELLVVAFADRVVRYAPVLPAHEADAERHEAEERERQTEAAPAGAGRIGDRPALLLRRDLVSLVLVPLLLAELAREEGTAG